MGEAVIDENNAGVESGEPDTNPLDRIWIEVKTQEPTVGRAPFEDGLGVTTPNPKTNFPASPFYVTTSLHPWERNGGPRRAAVSSFERLAE